MGNKVLRAHAIAENELRKYSDLQDAMDRYNLAATERNIRYIYLRFYGLENPAASMLSNIDLITEIREGLAGEGLLVGDPAPMQSFSVPWHFWLILSLGIVAASGWLFAYGVAPFADKRLLLPYGILLVAGCLGCTFLLLKAPVLARKLLALAGAIVFPSLGIVLALGKEAGAASGAEAGTASGKQAGAAGKTAEVAGSKRAGAAGKAAEAAGGKQAGAASGAASKAAGAALPYAVRRLQPRVLLQAVRSFLVLSAFTFAGAMVMSALLVEPAFMLKLDGFVGVKAAHIIPLAIVPGILWLREKDWFGIMKSTVTSPVRLWQLAAGLAVLVGLAVYVLRTGNDSLGAVTDIEMQVRQILDRFLLIRPRTKEFLIGHPLMLVLLYFGYKFEMLPVLVIGTIGQISLINTYAHIHTPVMVSVLRSVHGLWIGVLLGAAAVALLLWVFRLAASMGARYGRGDGHDLS
jgi:hypothetical protein